MIHNQSGWARLGRGVCFFFLSVLTVAPVFGQVSVLTQHNDNARTGANLNETILNTSNVNAAHFGRLFTQAVDGEIYAQPLYVANVAIAGKGVHNVIYVATMHNSVYAFDADDGTQPALWSVNYGPPVPQADVQCCCTDISTEIGILSTPVIDLPHNKMYFVHRNKNADGTYHQWLHAVDITSGADLLNGPVEIQATSGTLTFNPRIGNQRSALTLANGLIYIAWSSHNDCYAYHGWVMAYNAATLARTAVYVTTPTSTQGGVWQSGQGLTVDSANNLYFITGNGGFTQDGINLGDSFIKLNGSLTMQDYFTPSNQAALKSADLDLGAGGALALPGTNTIVGGGKQGFLYLVDTGNMGKFNSGGDQVIQEFQACNAEIFGSPVYWRDPSHGPTIYIWGADDKLKAYQLVNGLLQTTPVSTSTMSAANGIPGGILSVSANGGTPGSGIVWAALPYNGDADHAVVGGILRAFNASDLSNELWDSRMNANRDDVGNFAKFSFPTIANGKVYLATFSNQLDVYGLLSASPPPPANLTATAGDTRVTVSWSASSGATSYNVKRSTVNGASYATVASPGTTSATDTGLTNGTTYYYVVTAINSFGESPNSAQASATPAASGGTVILTPIADAYVRGGTYADTNFGAKTIMASKKLAGGSTNSFNRCFYLKFDLTGITTAPNSAALTLTVNAGSTPAGGSENVRIYSVSDNTWTETGITCNNAPALNGTDFTSTGTLLTSQTVPIAFGAVASFDITSFIQSNIGHVVTLQLIDATPQNVYLVVNSREASSGKPTLTLQ